MPRTAKKNERRTTGDERRLMVWRFVDYESRYGARAAMERMQQTVPQYIRWYLNAWNGEGGDVLVALNRLRADKEFIWEQGAIVELLTVATNTQPEYQGYLVSSRKMPMTASEVGSILRVDGRKALAVLTRCEAVGILERVEWPVPNGDSGGDIPDYGSLRLLQNVAEASRKAQRKGGGKRRFRNENEGPPLNKVEAIEKSAAQTKIEVTPGGRDAAPPEGGQAAQAKKAGQAVCPKCGHTGQAPKGAKALQCTRCNTVTPAATTPIPKTPISSTSPDRWAGLDGQHAQSSPQAGLPSVVRLADVLEGQRHRYSAEANTFGEAVLAATGYVTHGPGEHVNEVAHWAKLWEEAAGSLTEIGLANVRRKVLTVAGRIRTRRQQYECPEAYLERTMQNAMRDQKRGKRTQTG